MICGVCKYAPLELFAGFGQECRVPTSMAADTGQAEAAAHGNLCGFGKAIIQEALTGAVGDLLLTNCCDVMRRTAEVVAADDARREAGRFLHLMDLPHGCGPCQVEQLARQLKRVRDAYAAHTGLVFDLGKCQEALRAQAKAEPVSAGPYIAILGARVGSQLEELVADAFSLPVHNLACVGSRRVVLDAAALSTADEDAFFLAYAKALLVQVPCMRMADTTARRALFEDPNLRGIVYHTMKFCDFYGAERAAVQRRARVPVLALETDYTLQSLGQLKTRIQAFAETIGARAGGEPIQKKEDPMPDHAHAAGAPRYYAGIDSGSTSTDVVVVDAAGAVVATHIVPTGGGAQASAAACLDEALAAAGIPRHAVAGIVTTGYGREYLAEGDSSVTEISCHARGARALDARVRTIIDIGGQDSKAIVLDAAGNVANFAMNDKCAAGTGRFLEMMARALQLSLEDMAQAGLSWKEDIAISSMCSVFAESEVVSLVAQSKAVPDIVHGLNVAVAAKTAALVRRVGGEGPFMMTGGVARNAGVVRAIEERLGAPVAVPAQAQLAGALGAALIAAGIER